MAFPFKWRHLLEEKKSKLLMQRREQEKRREWCHHLEERKSKLFAALTSEEEQITEDDETGKLAKRRKVATTSRPAPFGGVGPGPADMSRADGSRDTATKHVAAANPAHKLGAGQSAASSSRDRGAQQDKHTQTEPDGAATEHVAGSSGAASQHPEVVDLVAPKEEEDTAPCRHTKFDEAGLQWPKQADMGVALWSGNKVPDSKRADFVQFLDSSLFQGNMRAWKAMQEMLEENPDDFNLYKMSTGSGHRGAMLECTRCGDTCKMQWKNTSDLSCSRLEICRQRVRQFLGFSTAGKHRQPIR